MMMRRRKPQLFLLSALCFSALALHVLNAQSSIGKDPWPGVPMKDLNANRARPLQGIFYFIENRLHAAIGSEQGSPTITNMIVPRSPVSARYKPGQMAWKTERLHVHFTDGEM